MARSYEDMNKHLNKLWQEYMSDEDDDDIGDEYQPSDASEPEDNYDEDDNEPSKKRTNYHMRKVNIRLCL